MIEKTLVILAAGRGSRFGGIKQLQTFQPQGATLVEYGLWDALQAGFSRFVAVVSEDTKEAFQSLFARWKISDRARCVLQTREGVPTAWQKIRKKPWGTGHALWQARSVIQTPFVIINADDFYGAEAYQQAADFLENRANEMALVSYPLASTLSPNGTVSRALCQEKDHRVIKMEEYTGIERCEEGVVGFCGKEKVKLDPQQPVSVNFFVLQPSLFPLLEQQWQHFLSNVSDPIQEEFYLPNAVQAIAKEQGNLLYLLNNKNGDWFGMTYASDQALMQQVLFEKTKKGQYPSVFCR